MTLTTALVVLPMSGIQAHSAKSPSVNKAIRIAMPPTGTNRITSAVKIATVAAVLVCKAFVMTAVQAHSISALWQKHQVQILRLQHLPTFTTLTVLLQAQHMTVMPATLQLPLLLLTALLAEPANPSFTRKSKVKRALILGLPLVITTWA